MFLLLENRKIRAFVTWISLHGNPKTRLLNYQFPALVTKVYFPRTQRSNCIVVIIKKSALLKTQHMNTESFPQNLLLCQATLTKMTFYNQIAPRLAEYFCCIFSNSQTCIYWNSLSKKKKNTNKKTNSEHSTLAAFQMTANSSKNIMFTYL